MWTQNYDPCGQLLLSAMLAAIPIVVLLGSLALFHVRAHWAALLGLVAALVIAWLGYGMPLNLTAAAAGYGAAYGLFPIGWIVCAAIFVYDITVSTGQFEIVKQTIAGLSRDARIQVLLIAFSFGAFIEGAAGFGTPVAISAAMLIGLGFRPLQAAGLALIGNTAPVAFGALGTPLIMLSTVTQLPLEELSAMVGRQLPIFALIVPFWLCWTMSGWRGMWEVWPACLTAGLSFGTVQYLVSNYHGPWLVDVLSALVSILSVFVLLLFWQPRRVQSMSEANPDPVTRSAAFRAWTPWLILSVLVFLWGLPQFKGLIDRETSQSFQVPGLHLAVERAPPVVIKAKAEEALFKFNWLSATGTALFLSGLISARLLGLGWSQTARIFLQTLKRTRISLITIAAMLALGFTTRYSGMDATLGLAFANTGDWFPFFSPLLGWLGVALTGSDTSSNVLFGNLQQITAEKLGMSPVLAAAANSSGGVMGKMIDAQSIVVASVATGQHGEEGKILRYVLGHSIVLALLVGCLVAAQAHGLPKWVPEPLRPVESATVEGKIGSSRASRSQGLFRHVVSTRHCNRHQLCGNPLWSLSGCRSHLGSHPCPLLG